MIISIGAMYRFIKRIGLTSLLKFPIRILFKAFEASDRKNIFVILELIEIKELKIEFII